MSNCIWDHEDVQFLWRSGSTCPLLVGSKNRRGRTIHFHIRKINQIVNALYELPYDETIKPKMTNIPTTFRTIFIAAVFTIFICDHAKAQPRKGEFIDVSIGLGLSAPNDEADIGGTGFYAQGEYVVGLTKWFGIRPYAGLVLTSADNNNYRQTQSEYEVTSKAFLLGGKVRIAAPIPWVAPYIEIGLGASIGSFVTYTPYTDKEDNGLMMHIPYTIGLALGPKHNFDIAFTYYEHPSVDQFAGAAAFGFSFPLNR